MLNVEWHGETAATRLQVPKTHEKRQDGGLFSGIRTAYLPCGRQACTT